MQELAAITGAHGLIDSLKEECLNGKRRRFSEIRINNSIRVLKLKNSEIFLSLFEAPFFKVCTN